MSISDDNTNELDSYGVWVKNNTENTPADSQGVEEALDLPDFDDADFSDMFKDDSQFNTGDNIEESFSDDMDSTLSTDELANITDFGDVSIEQVDAPEATTDDSEELNFTESFEVTEETPAIEDASSEFEEVTFGDDEEISIDDFMTEGFSDDSVASGNNGYEPGAEPQAAAPSSSSTEELSLDDFLDGDSFDMAPPEAKQQEETVEDEPPLEMDISFDDSTDTVQTEDNFSLEDNFEDSDDSYTEETSESVETEEVSLDDFGSSFEASEVTPNRDSEISTEEVDLMDFGIDTNAEETPITQDVEESKKKDVVVDYDLSVGDENTSAAPVVSEIKDDKTAEVVAETAPAAAIPDNSTVVENSLLQQIVSDLSGLKDEINRLKQNLEEMKTAEPVVKEVSDTASFDDSLSDIGIEETKDDGGFFSNDDGDDTIALSCDELNNIMNTAEFAEESVNVESEETVEEEPQVDVEEPVFEEAPETVEVETEENTFPTVEEPVIETEEITIEETPSFEDSIIEEAEIEVPAEEEVSFDEVTTEEPVFDSVPVEEPAAEEPVFDSFETETTETIEEVTETNFDESVTFEETPVEETAEEPVFEETVIEESPAFEETEIEVSTDEAPVFEDSIIDEETLVVDEPVIEEETPVFEETFVETPVEEPVFEETIVEETPAFEETEIEVSTDEAPVFEDSIIEEETSDESVESDITFEYENEQLEEPVIDEISVDTDDTEEDDLPSEIEISKEDDMFVESTSSDFMESVQDVSLDETISEDIPMDLPEESLEEPVVEDTIEEEITAEDDIPTVDKLLDSEDTEIDNSPFEIDEALGTSEPEPEIQEEETEVSFAEVDNLDNNLSDSNLDYLTKKDNNGINADLKQDIKSVLLYMDQLLENLPEEKISEFAKSDEFNTYKKLFSELGLS